MNDRKQLRAYLDRLLEKSPAEPERPKVRVGDVLDQMRLERGTHNARRPSRKLALGAAMQAQAGESQYAMRRGFDGCADMVLGVSVEEVVADDEQPDGVSCPSRFTEVTTIVGLGAFEELTR
jgi:hypothetical protein